MGLRTPSACVTVSFPGDRVGGRARGQGWSGGRGQAEESRSGRPHPRALRWCRPREGLAAAGLAPLSVRRGARVARAQGGRSREKLRGRQRRRGRFPRVCSAPHAAAGAAFLLLLSLPSAPECGGTASFRAARLPPDLSARVSGGHGRLLMGAGECSLFLFGRSPLCEGCCLFLETLFSAILGVPGAGVTPVPLPPHLPPNPVSLARPTRACPRPPGVPWPLPPRGPGLGQELAGWARACLEVGVFVLAPRPARRGGEGGERSGGRAGEAWAGPARALAPARASSGSPSRAEATGSPRRAELALPRFPRA